MTSINTLQPPQPLQSSQQSLDTTNKTNVKKVGFVSLGCPKALVDSENILTRLRTDGYVVSPSYNDADVVVVNTCGFIDSAVQESLDAIGEALQENGKVIVTGCLGAKSNDDGENLVHSIHPKVLGVTGPHATNEVLDMIHEHLPLPEYNAFIDLVPPQGIKLTPKHYAYLKISEGCNHRCTFCIIPSMRGDLDSRAISDVLTEAEHLLKSGVRELLVVSQDTSAYGVDKKYKLDFHNGQPIKTRLFELCDALGSLAEKYGGAWVRLHYVYPYPSVDDLIPLMAQKKILPYLDIPLQHSNQRILKLMKRPAHGEKNLERIQKWREICPDLHLRSTFIVGFPGETEEEFEELLNFLKLAKLNRAGAFAYSPVKGATANELENPVLEEVKQQRLARFMQTQAEISAQLLQEKIGQTIEVIVDESDEEGILARTIFDAPDIDGNVCLAPDETVAVGDRFFVLIEEADEHDLYAVRV